MQKATWFQFGVPCAALLLVSACTSPANLSERAIGFNEAIADAADAQLLLNVVRAAYRSPTHYTAVSILRESRTTEGNLSVTGLFPFGPSAVRAYSLAPTASMRANEQPSLDIAPLDNKAAASGLYRSIEPQTFFTFWQQAWPPAVLLHMLVDDITIDDIVERGCNMSGAPLIPIGKFKKLDNAAPTYSHFKWVKRLFECIQPGLHLVEEPDEKVYIRSASIPAKEVLKKLPDLHKDFKIEENKNKPGLYTVSKPGKKLQLKLRRRLGKSIAIPIGARTKADETPAAKGLHVGMTLRSVDGMIYYLGELVRLQLAGELPTIRIGQQEVPLFKVDIDQPTYGQAVEVNYLGHRFAVQRNMPVQDLIRLPDRTLTVLSLVSQLFALYREEKELPKTTAVQIVGGQ